MNIKSLLLLLGVVITSPLFSSESSDTALKKDTYTLTFPDGQLQLSDQEFQNVTSQTDYLRAYTADFPYERELSLSISIISFGALVSHIRQDSLLKSEEAHCLGCNSFLECSIGKHLSQIGSLYRLANEIRAGKIDRENSSFKQYFGANRDLQQLMARHLFWKHKDSEKMREQYVKEFQVPRTRLAIADQEVTSFRHLSWSRKGKFLGFIFDSTGVQKRNYLGIWNSETQEMKFTEVHHPYHCKFIWHDSIEDRLALVAEAGSEFNEFSIWDASKIIKLLTFKSSFKFDAFGDNSFNEDTITSQRYDTSSTINIYTRRCQSQNTESRAPKGTTVSYDQQFKLILEVDNEWTCRKSDNTAEWSLKKVDCYTWHPSELTLAVSHKNLLELVNVEAIAKICSAIDKLTLPQMIVLLASCPDWQKNKSLEILANVNDPYLKKFITQKFSNNK